MQANARVTTLVAPADETNLGVPRILLLPLLVLALVLLLVLLLLLLLDLVALGLHVRNVRERRIFKCFALWERVKR